MKKRRNLIKEVTTWILPPLIALAVGLLVREHLIGAYVIPSSSMEDTLLINDRVLVNKTIGEVERGDLVVFEAHGGFMEVNGPEIYIKRVIALGGDTVECCSADGSVIVNGTSVDEPYVINDNHYAFLPVTLEEGELWVMGDNRAKSGDSRYRGPIDAERVVGVAFRTVWPLSRTSPL